jgi:hypothetical protein
MKGPVCGVLLGFLLSGGASAAERLWFDGQQLELKAQARACYLGFIELYDVDYFRAPARDTSCIRLSYLREFDAETLGEATREVFKDRHGAGLVNRYRVELEQVAAAYRPVAPGDRYLYCLEADGSGILQRDGAPTLQLPSVDFARRFLQIWVQGEESPDDPEWGFSSC